MQDIPRLVQEARKGFNSGVTLPYQFRIDQLRALATMIVENEQELMSALHTDLGKPSVEAFLAEVGGCVAVCASMMKDLQRFMEPEKKSKPIYYLADSVQVQKVPRGVVLIIAPWNLPINLALFPLIGSIAAGNSTVLKVSEITPTVEAALVKLIPKYLDSRVCRVVHGGVPEATILLKQKFDFICYTGNTAVGKIVMKAAAENLTPVLLELGGKCPVIVDATVDTDIAARRIIAAKVLNSGQVCVAPDYVLVDRKCADALIQSLSKALREQMGENPLAQSNYGRIVNDHHFQRLIKLLEGEKAIPGVKISHGGLTDAEKRFIEPTVISGLGKEWRKHPIMREEIFGPLLPVIEFDSIDEAIQLANEIGAEPLSYYPFSTNNQTLEKIRTNINGGMFVANDVMAQLLMSGLPFGGVGNSGTGNYHGEYSFNTFSRPQTVLVRKITFDWHNQFRYLNNTPTYDSPGFQKFRRIFLQIPTDFELQLRNLFRNIDLYQNFIRLLILVLGVWIGVKFFQ